MKQVWYSIRATVAVIIVVALCLFVGIFTYLGKIEGAAALKVLETLGILVVTFYFVLKDRNVPTRQDRNVPTRPENIEVMTVPPRKSNLLAPVRRAK